MKSPICDMLGIDFPLFAFSHCRDVVAAVSRAGGFGVFGASSYTPEQIEIELSWIDDHIDGKPYGVDLLIPENLSIRTGSETTLGGLAAQVPQAHRAFVHDLLRRHDIDPMQGQYAREDPNRPVPYQLDTGERMMEVAFRHPIRLIA